ncbi:MAG: hypothetical protein IJH79_05325, partial [Lentisphaeria bacterium]|nr:hypothetical protein [Lentisphaeria bacterium]
MKKTILTAAAVLLGLAAAAVDLTGTWAFNPWKGYKPLPKMEKEDGTVHVYDVKGQYGFGLKSKKKIAVKAGDRVKFTAMVKGKGKMFFQLQDFDVNGKWIGVAPGAARAQIPADWKEITLSVKVENHKDRVTGFSIPTIGAGKGSELYFKNSRAEVETSEYAGDYRFPRHWTVFAPVPKDFEAPLDRIPAEIGGVKGKSVPLDNNMIILAPFFPERKIRNTAWLYAELNAPSAGTYTIGAGADYFMAIYLNGKCVLDTLKSGDESTGPHFSNHKVNVQVKKGKNIIAVKFQSGSGQRPAISLGGADDLRNLSSILTVTETYVKDDYENPGKRSGDPELIKGIITDGIETLTGQGVYKSGSIIAFAGKTYPMPPKIGGKLFAVGLRLYKFSGAGEIVFRIGKNRTLTVGRSDAKSDLTMTVLQNGRKLKSTILPIIALPSDIIFAADANEYYVNAMSLQDSKLRSVTGRAPFTEKAPFPAVVEVKTDSVTVDEFFTGLAKREVKS